VKSSNRKPKAQERIDQALLQVINQMVPLENARANLVGAIRIRQTAI